MTGWVEKGMLMLASRPPSSALRSVKTWSSSYRKRPDRRDEAPGGPLRPTLQRPVQMQVEWLSHDGVGCSKTRNAMRRPRPYALRFAVGGFGVWFRWWLSICPWYHATTTQPIVLRRAAYSCDERRDGGMSGKQKGARHFESARHLSSQKHLAQHDDLPDPLIPHSYRKLSTGSASAAFTD